ncbi:MAG: hypothetical protein MK289_18140, partial [Trichodesmium sp. ALOHA_ZT_67]|nr:hypothetical protein [Trichodesmium sp. ALOHA_ZT_67]
RMVKYSISQNFFSMKFCRNLLRIAIYYSPQESIVCAVNSVIIDINLFLSCSKLPNISHFNFMFISNHNLSIGFNSGE